MISFTERQTRLNALYKAKQSANGDTRRLEVAIQTLETYQPDRTKSTLRPLRKCY